MPGRRLVIIGESIGALVGLATCDGRLPADALVLLDPPLSTAKQWVVQANIAIDCKQAPHWFRNATAEQVFGMDVVTNQLHERLYYAGFANLRVPCLIVRGDVPLFPMRASERTPNCFDDVDAFIVRTLQPSCRIECLSECGHLVFLDGGMRCHDLIRNFLARVIHV